MPVSPVEKFLPCCVRRQYLFDFHRATFKRSFQSTVHRERQLSLQHSAGVVADMAPRLAASLFLLTLAALLAGGHNGGVTAQLNCPPGQVQIQTFTIGAPAGVNYFNVCTTDPCYNNDPCLGKSRLPCLSWDSILNTLLCYKVPMCLLHLSGCEKFV